MQRLVDGIHQFQQQVFRSHKELFERLNHQQQPEVLFITCSDSRINPNLITQTLPGELFILRNAGNLVPPHGTGATGEAATIEFAVGALKVRDIIVCGHSGCGAMRALCEPELMDDLPAMKAWLHHADATARIVRENYTHLEGQARLTATVEENVLVQIENLRTHPTVAAAVASGRLRLHGWVYKMETGDVFGYDPEKQQFGSITSAETQGAPRDPSFRQLSI